MVFVIVFYRWRPGATLHKMTYETSIRQLSPHSNNDAKSAFRHWLLSERYFAMNYCEPFPRRVLYFVFGAFITIGSIALGFSLLAKRAELNQGEAVFNSLFILVILCCGIGLMTTSVRFRLTLTPRSLTLRRAFTTRTIARSDIADYGKMTLQGNTTLYLFSSRQRRAIMRIPYVFEDGDAVMAWMAQRR